MSVALHGLPISPGIAIGRVQIVSHLGPETVRQDIAPRQMAAEQSRLIEALKTTRDELSALKEHILEETPAEMSAIIDVHIMILEDAEYSQGALDLIKEELCNADWALVQQMRRLAEKFFAFEDEYLRERGHDVIQVTERVLKVLAGRSSKVVLAAHKGDLPPILVGYDFSPTDTLQLRHAPIASFITDVGGGTTSHTAIVARSMRIPAVSGLHNARILLHDQELIIVDGGRGVVIVNPDAKLIDEYHERRTQYGQNLHRLKSLQRSRSMTQDGVEVALRANLEMPDDVVQASKEGAEGVGLFRTEFLFLNRDRPPGEDEQFEAYRRVLRAMQGFPVTIRTMDLGADKSMRGDERISPNPALGLRGIRYCLADPNFFLRQLRALIRASRYGQLRILVPMMAHREEIRRTLALVEQAKQELSQKKVPFNRDIAVGAMIEIPAAALALEPFLHHLDFLSIGTNDLIQYTLAVDRSDDEVAHLYDPLHPAVLWLIEHVIRIAQRAKLSVAMCGEMAGDPNFTRLLLGMGLKEFSMHASQILEVKRRVLQSNFGELEGKTKRLLKQPERIHEQLQLLNEAA